MNEEDKKLLEVAICGYLPYGLKCHLTGMHEEDYVNPVIPTIFKIIGVNSVGVITNQGEYTSWYFEDVFLILNPIEYLTKPIKVEGYNDGKEFVPIKELGWEYYGGELGELISCEYGENPRTTVNVIDYASDMDKLNQWHIDWRGLIPKGLAVAITEI